MGKKIYAQSNSDSEYVRSVYRWVTAFIILMQIIVEDEKWSNLLSLSLFSEWATLSVADSGHLGYGLTSFTLTLVKAATTTKHSRSSIPLHTKWVTDSVAFPRSCRNHEIVQRKHLFFSSHLFSGDPWKSWEHVLQRVRQWKRPRQEETTGISGHAPEHHLWRRQQDEPWGHSGGSGHFYVSGWWLSNKKEYLRLRLLIHLYYPKKLHFVPRKDLLSEIMMWDSSGRVIHMSCFNKGSFKKSLINSLFAGPWYYSRRYELGSPPAGLAPWGAQESSTRATGGVR